MNTQTEVERTLQFEYRVMSLNAPLDKSSDKSSDSGGLLDLSSRGLSEGEETWLFTMEAKMKGENNCEGVVLSMYDGA